MARLAWRVAIRLAAAVPVLAGVVAAAFLLTRVLPGDPAVHLATGPSVTAADIAALRAELGLDRPLAAQFGAHVAALLRGDLGLAVHTGRPVADEIALRLPASLELAVAALAVALAVALPLAAAAARHPGGRADRAAAAVAALTLALPGFVAGLLMIRVFYLDLGIAPEPVGRLDPFLAPPPRVTGLMTLDALLAGDRAVLAAALAQIAMPAAALSLVAVAPVLRMARAALGAALASDAIRTARALGLGPGQVAGWALRLAAPPVIAAAAHAFCGMLGAAVLVEQVFAWPGLGRFAIEAMAGLDHAALQGAILALAAVVLAVHLAADLAVAALDPRAGPAAGGGGAGG
jgi:peptide/nickel transport system permease protein